MTFIDLRKNRAEVRTSDDVESGTDDQETEAGNFGWLIAKTIYFKYIFFIEMRATMIVQKYC